MNRKILQNQNLFVCLLIFFAFIISGCGKSGNHAGNHVLIVQIEDSTTDSYGIKLFNQALKSGGQVPITVSEIRSAYPDFEEKYTIAKNGEYYTQGAVINFITDHGWQFKSRDFGGIVFVKTK